MIRTIYEVYAKVVDANGSYNTLTGYPKTFDSRSYGGDTEKTLQRAKGEFHNTFGDMCKIDSLGNIVKVNPHDCRRSDHRPSDDWQDRRRS